MDYGTGAVMAVPAHDSRDFEFAKQYHLPIQTVITATQDRFIEQEMKAAYTGTGYLVHSGEFTGLTTEEAKLAIKEYLIAHSKGYPKIHYRLRDWEYLAKDIGELRSLSFTANAAVPSLCLEKTYLSSYPIRLISRKSSLL